MEKLQLVPEQSGYTYESDNSVITITLQGGYSRTRLDLYNSSAKVICTWRLKDGDYQYFRAFYYAVTEKGVVPFLIDLVLDQPYVEEYEAKFVPQSVQTANPEGLTYEVSAELEVIPIVDVQFNESLVDVYNPDGYEFLNDLDKLVNIHINALG